MAPFLTIITLSILSPLISSKKYFQIDFIYYVFVRTANKSFLEDSRAPLRWLVNDKCTLLFDKCTLIEKCYSL